MEKDNINDIVRKDVFDKVSNCKSQEDKQNIIFKIFEDLKKDKTKLKLYLQVLYATSYFINYSTLLKFPDDEEIKSFVEILDSFNDINELMESMDDELFYALCNDTIFFDNLYFYQKKFFVNSVIEKKDKLKNISPLLIFDIAKYNKKPSSSYILDIYERCLTINLGEKNIAMEDSICDSIDYLVDLEKQDYDSFEHLYSQILEIYYMYNTYLIENNYCYDEFAPDIIYELNENFKNYILFSCGNPEAIEPVIRDFLTYNLLSEDEKKNVVNYFNHSDNKNPNKIIRRYLKCLFSELNLEKESDAEYYYEELEFLKNNKEKFKLVTHTLYSDVLTRYYYQRDAEETNEDLISEIKNLERMKTIEEFTEYLLQDDYALLNAIDISISYDELNFMDKKEIALVLLNKNMYKNYIVKNYMFDVFDSVREYTYFDSIDIYTNNMEFYDDIKTATTVSSVMLEDDLKILSEMDKNNYNDLIYDITKIYYKCMKYFIEKDLDYEKDDFDIVNKIEKDLNTFLVEVINNPIELHCISRGFYEYFSYEAEKKKDIDDFYNNLTDEGRAKKFIKKQKNS